MLVAAVSEALSEVKPLPPMKEPEELRRPARLHATALARSGIEDCHSGEEFDLDAYMRLPVEQYTLSVLEMVHVLPPGSSGSSTSGARRLSARRVTTSE